jgi:diguanylate cyclase (GGDEF)-like protein/PAS domain S-box-containing protein
VVGLSADDDVVTARSELDEAARVAREYLASAALLAKDYLAGSGTGAGASGEDPLAAAERVAVELIATAERTAVDLLSTAEQVAIAKLASTHRFEAMFRDHDAMMLLIDPQTGQIVDANSSAAAYYGYPPAVLRSMSITQINTMSAEEVAAALDQVASGESGRGHFLFSHRLASGEIRRVDVHTALITDGQPLLFSIIIDVEDSARAQEELARVSAYSRRLIEASLDPLVTISADGVISDVNAATERVTGVPRQALIGSDFADYFTDPDRARAGYRQAFTEGSVTDYPLAIRNVNGDIIDVSYNATVYRDDDGTVAGVFAAARDVTERNRTERLLAASEEESRLAFDRSRVATGLVSNDGRFIRANPAICELLGRSEAELLSLGFLDVTHPDDVGIGADQLREMMEGRRSGLRITKRYVTGDGRVVWGDVTVSAVLDANGHLRHRIVQILDVSSEHNLLEALHETQHIAHLGGWTFDVKTDRVTWSPELFAMFGLDPTGPVPEFAEQHRLFMPESWQRVSAAIAQTQATGVGYTVDLETVRSDGTHGWIQARGEAIRGLDGSIVELHGMSLDITARKQWEAANEAIRAKLERAQRIAHVGSWTFDSATNHVTWTEELFLMLGLDPTTPVPEFAEFGKLFTPASWQDVSANVAATQATGDSFDIELEMVRSDGSHGWMQVRGEAVRDSHGVIVGVQGVALDITPRKVASDELQVLATHDRLTGLANRAELLDELSRAISSGRRSGRPMALLMMDLDRFKDVNDTLGHAAGDDLLVAAALRIEQVVRTGDVVARLGGDEFVIVMRDLGDPIEAVNAADRLVTAFRAPFLLAGAELYATASVGLTTTTGTTDSGDLLREADTAMYAAKDAGRDQVAVFNADLRTAVAARLAVEAELRHALERGQFDLWYQPEVDLATGTVRAVEALLRWHHPSGEIWVADRFIRVAEESGRILEIGEWVLSQACHQGAAWTASNPNRPITVRVNVSALQLADGGLLDTIDDALNSSGLDPRLLCIEITETALLGQTATARVNLDGIHARGIEIAIDDFGTGYASLTYLDRYPIDVIKIDRSFITDTTAPEHDHRLVAGIIALAAILGISVTAEGVEQPDQAAHLRAMGCPTAQGWLYSAALPPEEVTPLLDHIYPHA